MANGSDIEMLQFPLGIANSDNAFYKNRKVVFMAINGQSLTDKGKYYWDTKTNTYANGGEKEAKCLITLPMPNDLSDSQNHLWEESTYFDAITGALSSNVESTSDGENTNTKRTSQIGSIMASISASLGAITDIAGTRKPMLNPGYFQNYSSSSMRTFNFSYTFIPRNKEEAGYICKIVKAFKQYSSPQKGLSWNEAINNVKEALGKESSYPMANEKFTELNGMMESNPDLASWTNTENSFIQMSPFVWNIIIFNHQVRELSQIKTCACSDISVKYGNGNFDTFEDGMPKVITLDLTFKEMELQYYNMYDTVKINVQCNNPTASVSTNVSSGASTAGKTSSSVGANLQNANATMASSVAGNIKSANILPEGADGKKSGLIDSITVTGSGLIDRATPSETGILDSISRGAKTISEGMTSVLHEANTVVSGVSNTVRDVNTTIEETVISARNAVRETIGSVIRRVL